jgi:hypothetical protein
VCGIGAAGGVGQEAQVPRLATTRTAAHQLQQLGGYDDQAHQGKGKVHEHAYQGEGERGTSWPCFVI